MEIMAADKFIEEEKLDPKSVVWGEFTICWCCSATVKMFKVADVR
jgi:hypothetical protein